MTDWWRLPSYAGCSFVVSLCVCFCVCICSYLCVCVYFYMSVMMKDWARFGLDPGYNKRICVCTAGPVADVVQTWTFAFDCCLHIYLHDYVRVYLYVCMCVSVQCVCWMGWGFSQINIRRLSNKNHLSCRWKYVPVSHSSPLPDQMCRLECMLCVCASVCVCAGCGLVNSEAAQTADMTNGWQPHSSPHQPCISLAG